LFKQYYQSGGQWWLNCKTRFSNFWNNYP